MCVCIKMDTPHCMNAFFDSVDIFVYILTVTCASCGRFAAN